MNYKFSDEMRTVISKMVESHRANPDRFFVIRSSAGNHLTHTGLDLDPISNETFDKLLADEFIDAQRSEVELTQRAYDAYDSGFDLQDDNAPEPPPPHPAEQEPVANLADAPVDHPALAEALENLSHALDSPDTLTTPILSRLAEVFRILADHPEYLNRTHDYILDSMAVLGVLGEEEPTT